MARELYQFAVKVPAGTPKSALAMTAMQMPTRVVRSIQIVVPPGPRGELGFQLGTGGYQILPINQGAFLVTDDEHIDWALEEQMTSGAWQLIGYNTGFYDHTVYVRFLVDLTTDQVAQGTQLVDGGSISSGGSGTVGAIPSVQPMLPPVPAPPPLPAPTAPLAPIVTPPLQPVLALPGQGPVAAAAGGRSRSTRAMQYGGLEHLFFVDQQGTLHHLSQAPGGNPAPGPSWADDTWSWAAGLIPGGLVNVDQFNGQAHVYAGDLRGGILHAAQTLSGGGASTWGGETIGGASAT